MKSLVQPARRLLAYAALLLTLSITTSARADNFSTYLIDSVHVRVGDSTTSWISLRNETDSIVTVYATISGPDSAYFRFSAYTINLGSDSLSTGTLLYFYPSEARTYSVTLTFSDGQSIQSFHMTGSATETPTGLVTSMARLSANVGGSEEGYVNWYNPSSHNDTIEYASIGGANASYLSVLPNQFPLVIHSHMYGHVMVNFSPTSAVSEVDTMEIAYREEDGTLRNATGYIWVDGIGTPDTTVEGLANDSNQTISVNGTRPGPVQHIVEIRNNTGSQRRVESVSMLDGTHFSAEVTAPTTMLPFELPDMSSMMVLVTLLDNTPGTFNDTIIVVTSDGLQALRFPVTGTRGPVAAVHSSSESGVQMTASPNPTNGVLRLTFGSLRSAEVTVWDFLGRQVVGAQHMQSGEAVSGLGNLANGNYLVRVTGITEDGQSYSKSSPFVLQR